MLRKLSCGNVVIGFWLLSLLCVSASVWAQKTDMAQGVNLAEMMGWDIVVAEDAIASEHYAAKEFQTFFSQASGITLPIVGCSSGAGKHVFIGASGAMRASDAGFEVAKFGDEDFRIVVRDQVIVIAGGRPRGALYGVYTFLEDYLGVRFLTAEHNHVPSVGDWRVVGPVDRFYHPPLEYRLSFYGETCANQAFAVRLRNNGMEIDAKLGGRSKQRGINHSFYTQIPASRYGKDHPEYFCEIDGKRLGEVSNDKLGIQPCLTNPEVLRIVTDAVISDIESNPQYSSISVSQNDNSNYCRCSACRAIDEREGTPMGSLLSFVNAVADEVAKVHPEIKIGTLAYWYSRKPPKTIKPRDNVQIQLCSIECSMLQPISDPDCMLNVSFCKDFQEWSRICDDIRIWNYTTNFSSYLFPCPNK